MTRDMDAHPYSPDEARVAKWIADKGIGGGDDPIGFLMASHDYMAFQRNTARNLVSKMRALIAAHDAEEGA